MMDRLDASTRLDGVDDGRRSSAGAAHGVRRVPSRHDSRRGRLRRSLLEISLRVLMPFVVLALWQLTAVRGWIDPGYFPSPTTVWSTGVDLAESGRLWSEVWTTAWRVLQGFVWGSIIGFAMGIGLGLSRWLRAGFEPLVYAFWTIPKLAVLPLLLLIFGLGDTPMIILIVLNTLFLVAIPTYVAMASVSLEYRESAAAFGANRWQMFRHVQLPATIPETFVALRLAAGASVLVAVAAEFVNGNSGIGYLIWNSWQVFLPEPMYVGIVVVAVLGAIFTMSVGVVGRLLAPWAP